MNSWMAELERANVGEIRQDVPLARYTTWRIGGPADVLIIPTGKQELILTMSILHRSGVPWTIIGKGSNMLVSDKGIRGVVIKAGDALDYVEFDGTQLRAGAAYSIIKLTVMAGKQGLTGLEFAGGIPGTVGGAVYMNAGAHGSDVSRIFKSAEIVLETGELVTWGPEEMAFSYRHSRLQEEGSRGVVLEAVLELHNGDRKEIAAALATHKERRRRTQPLQQPSCGSVFRNPPGNYAAKLVEESGLKGFSIGGAQVSTMHANFIVNTGQATAEDVLTLIAHIRSTVKNRTGIELMPEVLVVGER
ncbi:UDP-N-acetylmuramate dehydrogenase [Paenibacillus herberti]|uniref:UDP-N-acetylenolpyruvoylglucosamine reductase n=1 Tax=Paenibacillus herberti TaxID=1619309 RepID=A0A229P174_9BACL|nr:UDP-N-acetylmuramate dehydrogenase [Paenibacillus herberti]OXM15685.1 UDP-N-acetylenolpyruvoylglucosamine reductase [Paenibacillus herberti]